MEDKTQMRIPDQDVRQYRHITLDNLLEVLLVHDQHTDKAAAAMDVHVGFFSDPQEAPGIAHFCEHMLFLGTEKYPDEKTYINYLTQHGGNWNAYTSTENTNYYYDVSHAHAEGALDRFAQFFIAPLFTQDATEREMNAINSEHKKNLQNDYWRSAELLKSASNPDYPYSKFGTGNLETLQQHADIRQKLLNFHSTYYSSNIMKLAVLGKEDLDTLEKWVREKFSAIKNKNIQVPTFQGEPFPPKYLGFRQHYVPVKDTRTLTLYWPIPPEYKLWKSKPGHVLGHLLGHEGEGSILAELKRKGWVNELLGGTLEEGLGFSFFGVQMKLAKDGFDHIDDIINIIYQYIAILNREGIDKWVFEELQSLGEIGFRFKDQSQPIDYVSYLAKSMQRYPRDHLLAGPYLMYEWVPELIQKALQALKPENMFITVGAKELDGKTDKKEKWYGTPYSQFAIEPSYIERLKSLEKEPPTLHLPKRNLFIPDSFDRHPPSTAIPKHPQRYTFPNSTIWHKYDTIYNIPKAYQFIDIITPKAYSSPRETVLTRLFCNLVMDDLNEYAYDAQVAGLYYSIENHFEGLQLIIKGYDCKQLILIEKIAEKMAHIHVDSARFQILKEALAREYANFYLEPPYRRALYQASICLDSCRWTYEEYLAECPTITLEEMKEFIPKLLEYVYYEGLFIGNITIEQAKNTVEVLDKYLKAKTLRKSQLPRKQGVILSSRSYIHRFPTFNPEDQNSAIQISFQIGQDSPAINAVIDLFNQCTTSDGFLQLRTTQQLGYIVWATTHYELGMAGYRVIIQSDSKNPVILEERIEEWIGTIEELLNNLPEEEFTKFKEGLIVQKLEKDKSLKEEAARWKVEIRHPRLHNFTRAEDEAAEVAKLTKSDLVHFYKQYIAKDAPQRKRFCTQVFGKDCPIPELSTPSEHVVVDNVEQFKKTHQLFPETNSLAQYLHD
eukprot:TRINITY_DN23144_c0_g1_i1.p1 TRINITY_DN23144_c0_g1~~TRINITY_DN23144_c0_g1_i1.p1  ORF type:complete len:973 (+),score=184.03 TRINITY_DN23144_c0_g1_i1:70-2919(+)